MKKVLVAALALFFSVEPAFAFGWQYMPGTIACPGPDYGGEWAQPSVCPNGTPPCTVPLVVPPPVVAGQQLLVPYPQTALNPVQDAMANHGGIVVTSVHASVVFQGSVNNSMYVGVSANTDKNLAIHAGGCDLINQSCSSDGNYDLGRFYWHYGLATVLDRPHEALPIVIRSTDGVQVSMRCPPPFGDGSSPRIAPIINIEWTRFDEWAGPKQ